MVIERSGMGERAYDIYSLLLKERVIILGEGIDADIANLIVAQLLFLDREDSERPVQLYVNSPGGSVYAGFAIYDTMQQVRTPVATTAVGITASFGTIILTAGDRGMRSALPHATIHMHQPLGGTEGQASDIVIAANHYQAMKDRLLNLLVERTGKDRATIERDTDRDIYLNAEQAVEYGLIDQVIATKPTG
jgi:ATP-dependent Clp protease protease subunit